MHAKFSQSLTALALLASASFAVPDVATPARRQPAVDSTARPSTPQQRDSVMLAGFLSRLAKDHALSEAQVATLHVLLTRDTLLVAPRRTPEARLGPDLVLSGSQLDQMQFSKLDTAALNREFEQHLLGLRRHHQAMQRRFVKVYQTLQPEQRKALAERLRPRGARPMGETSPAPK